MRNAVSNTCLVAASTVLGFLLMELVFSAFLIRMPRDLFLLGFSANPNSAISGIQINHQGFAGDAIDHPKSERALRVLTLGGSSFFNSDITHRLKLRLQQDMDRPVEVAGGALRSHTSASSLIKYTRYFYQYQVDYVLIYEGMNDLWANHVAPEDFRSDYSHIFPEYKRSAILENCIICRILYNKAYTQIYAAPERVYRGSQFASEIVFEENIRQLIIAIQKNGAKPVLITFAVAIPENYSHKNFELGRAGYSKNVTGGDFWSMEGWGEPDYVREGIMRHNKVIRKLAVEYDVDLIDQEKYLGDQLEYFGDVCHFSEPGVDAFVVQVSNYFKNQLKH